MRGVLKSDQKERPYLQLEKLCLEAGKGARKLEVRNNGECGSFRDISHYRVHERCVGGFLLRDCSYHEPENIILTRLTREI